MTTAEFKKIARLLKQVYSELEKEASEAGISTLSPEYDQLVATARERVLENAGYTLQEYREAKAKVVGFSQADLVDSVEQRDSKLTELDNRHIPNEDEIASIAERVAEKVAKKYIVPPQIINKIVDRETIKKPTIIKETVKETINVPFDPNPLLAEIGSLNERLENIKPEPIDIEAIKSDLKLDFNKELKHNIDMLGMPDFRKLAMGLQSQIDSIDITGGSGAVDSVNGQTGIVVLDTGDISAVTDYNYVTDAQLTVIGNTSGTNTGDQDLSSLAPKTSPTFATSITGSYLTASEILITDGSKNIVSAPVATYPSLTELTYLKGVTGAIQTQLDAKGTGNVTKVGTPVDNQLGIWTGDGTLEGVAGLTYNGTLLYSEATTTQLRLGYDATHYTNFTSDSAGRMIILNSGSVIRLSSFSGETEFFKSGTNSVVGVYNSAGSTGIFLDGANQRLNGSTKVEIECNTTGTITINETGRDIDFRIESDTLTSAFAIDGATGNITMQSLDTDLTAPTTSGTTKMVITDANGQLSFDDIPSGDVVGPASSTDNAITRFDGTTGKLVQDSSWTLDDNGKLALSTANGEALSIITSKGAGAGTDNLLYLEATNSSWDRPLLRINNAGTSGGAAHIRLDGVSPQIEFIEDDQSSPAGKFELQVQGDIFYLNGRNAADNSFENSVWFLRPELGGNVGVGVDPYNIEKLTIGETTGGSARIAMRGTSAPSADTNYGKLWADSTSFLPKWMDSAGTSYDVGLGYQPPFIGHNEAAPNSAANVGSANRAWYKAITVDTNVTVTGIRIGVAVSSGNIDVGIYNSAGTKLASSGSTACPSAGKDTVTFSSSIAITPGVYYLSLTADNTTATFSRAGTDTIMGLGYEDSAFPLPSTFSLSYQTIAGADRSFAILGVVTGGLTA